MAIALSIISILLAIVNLAGIFVLMLRVSDLAGKIEDKNQ